MTKHGPVPALVLEGVTRRFGNRWALRGVDLRAESGEVVVVFGANGTGKTTLLRIVSSLLQPTAGKVQVLGHTLPASAQAVRARTVFMSATGHAYDGLTGLENLRFAARMCGIETDDAALRESLGEVGLDSDADVPVRGYSAGMRKRLELARHRLKSPDLALLDEPFASLDDEGIELVTETVVGWRARNTTVLIASHRTTEAARLADRIIHLQGGRVTPEPEVDIGGPS